MIFVECLPVQFGEAEVVGEVDTAVCSCSDGPAGMFEFQFMDVDCLG